MPAEVLDALGGLNTTNATFIGRVPNVEFKAKLAKLVLREITGDLKKIERDIDRNATKLLIIAAPNWKYVLGHAGHEGRHTLVRIVNSVDSVPELVGLINEKSLTDVRVLGQPDLADQLAAQLNASGITVTKISGSNAAETAREALKKTIEKWEDRRADAAQHDAQMRSKMRTVLAERLTEMENKLNSLESELAERNASGAEPARVSELQARIDAARKQLSAIKEYIDSNNFDTARIRIDKALGEIESSRWTHRGALKIESNDVEDEEESTARVAVEIRGIEIIKERCNSDAGENLAEKMRALKQEYDKALSEGDEIKAARLAVEIRSIVAQINNIGAVCERVDEIGDKLEAAATARVKNIEIVKARIMARPIAIRPMPDA